MHHIVRQLNPAVVVVDPISNFISSAEQGGVKSMLIRLVDFLKMREITAMFTHLTNFGHPIEQTTEVVSSIMDTWLLLRDLEQDGYRSCTISVLKSRGMPHSHEVREFILSDNGISIGGLSTPQRQLQPNVATSVP